MPEPLYRIELTAAELDAIRLANILDRPIDATKVRARKVAVTTPPPTFNTGDAALDAFMRRTWRPEHAAAAAKRRAAGPVAPTVLKPRKSTRAETSAMFSFAQHAIAAWRSLGHEVVLSGDVTADGRNVRVLPLASE